MLSHYTDLTPVSCQKERPSGITSGIKKGITCLVCERAHTILFLLYINKALCHKSRYINFALTGIGLWCFQHPDRLIILPLRSTCLLIKTYALFSEIASSDISTQFHVSPSSSPIRIVAANAWFLLDFHANKW